MKVLKFGGSSLSSAERILRVMEIVSKETNCIIVLSANGNTTNELEKINKAISLGHRDIANSKIKKLKSHFKQLSFELIKTKRYFNLITSKIDEIFLELEDMVLEEHKYHNKNKILSKGELISSSIFCILLTEHNINSKYISALDFIKTNEHNEVDLKQMKKSISKLIDKNSKIHITEGFICKDQYNKTHNLTRGGSDYTASLISQALGAKSTEIWTDIDGFHNNDPRYVENTKPIRKLSFDEAAELAYFGAKIMHPTSIHPCKKGNIPVLLKNSLNPLDRGTIISNNTCQSKIKAIAAKDGITVIKIKSSRMLQAYGFLAKVFNIFDKFKTAIDLISTSEVAISLSIDNTSRLEEIVLELNKISETEIDYKQSIICIVGDDINENPGLAYKIFSEIKDINVRMISFGGSNHNISLIVNQSDKIKTINSLNKCLRPTITMSNTAK
ncbi:MAG: aspartate kinase [Marinifilaceae bacterium]|jgi:aspartate kinase|nr:aspartate kinase [Marinifilaceae bacterium]